MTLGRLTPLLVGHCPDDWQQVFIDEATELLTNGYVGPSLPYQTDDTENGVRYLQGFNVRPNKIDFGNATWVTKEFHERNPKSCLRAGDLLVVQSGHIGTAAVVPEAAAGSNCHALIISRFDRSKVDPHFVSHYINSEIGQARLRGLEVGSSMLHINTSELGRFILPLPSIGEQRRLAAILGLWEAAIEKTQQLIAAKERKLESATTRLYTFSNRKGSHSHFGAFLRESSVVGANGRHATKLSIKLYGKGVVPKDDKRTGSEQTQYFVRRAGQLVYSKLDFLNGAFGIVPAELDGYESTLDLPAFDINDSAVDPDWLLGYLTRPIYYTRQVGLARGQRKARRVHPSDFLASPLWVPSLDVQRQVAAALQTLKQDIEATESLLDAYKAQKRGLMQKLLTGQWRVRTETEEVPA